MVSCLKMTLFKWIFIGVVVLLYYNDKFIWLQNLTCLFFGIRLKLMASFIATEHTAKQNIEFKIQGHLTKYLF